LDQRAQELLAGNPDFQRLKTLPGIGAITALTILAEGAISVASAIIGSS
jgi:transposase